MRSGTQKLTGKQMMALLEPFEVSEVFGKALEKLDEGDRAAIEKLMSEGSNLPNVGRISATELAGKLAIFLFESNGEK